MAPLKIVIVGGGIAGLTLAIMLERFDIDYVLLEGHDEIAPPVGASIGLMPNGLVVLDQLGCYDDILKVAQIGAITQATTRNDKGQVTTKTEGLMTHLESRHGYPMLFFDRQWLLKVLADNVQHKERIMLQKRVDKVDIDDSGATVTTRDGSVFTGDIVVGADGIHSRVRNEMFRLAKELEPGYLDENEPDTVPCYYQCSFGIAQHVPNWIKGEQTFNTAKGWSTLIASGPDDRVYWFIFIQLPEVKYGRDVPRYTKEDDAAFAEKYAGLQILENVTFGDIYEKRLTSTLTPLHEVVFKKWSFRRMVLMGDSVHKPNPIAGQGGNGAIESCAAFVNALLDLKEQRTQGLDNLSVAEIQDVCQAMQAVRYERAKDIIKGSHEQQGLFAYENQAISKLALEVLGPISGSETPLNQLGGRFLGASRLDRLPNPNRPHSVPYDVELPAKPLSGRADMIGKGLFAAAMAFTLYTACKGGAAADSPFQLGGNSNNISHLAQLIAPLLIYTVEGHRLGNSGGPLALPSLFTVAVPYLGIGRVAPLYALVGALFDGPSDFSARRHVATDAARAVLPALGLGYAVAAVAAAVPGLLSGSAAVPETLRAAAAAAPLLVPVLTTVLSKGLAAVATRGEADKEEGTAVVVGSNGHTTNGKVTNGDAHKKKTKKTPSSSNGKVQTKPPAPVAVTSAEENPELAAIERGIRAEYTKADLPHLRRAYRVATAVQAAAHLAAVAHAVTSGESLLLSGCTAGTALATATTAAQCLYSIWSLRRKGYVTTAEAVKVAGLAAVGGVVLGPGAAWTGVWEWREGVVARTSTME